MSENPVTVENQIDGRPRLRDRTVRPEGTLPKQAQTYVIAGVSVVILLAVMFSKNHAQSAAKTQRKEPTVVITEGNDKKISDFGQEMTDEQRAAQKAQLEKQMNAQARSLESVSPQTQLADAQHVGSMQGTQPAAPPPDPIVQHERELAYNSRFASNFAFSAEHLSATESGARAGQPGAGQPPSPASGSSSASASSAPSASASAVKVADVAVAGRKLWKVLVPVVALVAAAILGAFYLRSRQATQRLTEKDSIVLADFANSTGDPVFDDTLKTALSVSLRQSPFLNVLSDGEVAKTLQEMTRPANTKLTAAVARELCLRAGGKAYLAGSIGSLGSEYVLGLKAVNCQSGDAMAQEQVTATSKEKVLDALGGAASKLRDSIRMTMARSLAWVGVPALRRTVSGRGIRPFDAAEWIQGNGTLYVINSGELGAAAPLFRAVIEKVHRDCVFAGSLTPYGRIPNPVLFALDEVTQTAAVPLADWLATSAGSGIQVCFIVHTPAQLRVRYGADAAKAIWALAGTKVVLGGNTDAEMAEEISTLAGMYGGEMALPVVPVAYIRQLPESRALVLAMNRSPIAVKVRPVWCRVSFRLGTCPPAYMPLPEPVQLPPVMPGVERRSGFRCQGVLAALGMPMWRGLACAWVSVRRRRHLADEHRAGLRWPGLRRGGRGGTVSGSVVVRPSP